MGLHDEVVLKEPRPERMLAFGKINWFSFLSLRRKSSTIKPPKPYKRQMANGANASSYSKKAEAGTIGSMRDFTNPYT